MSLTSLKKMADCTNNWTETEPWVFLFFYPLHWGPGRLTVGGEKTSKRIVIQMEWEICLPASKCCRWEEEMTMDPFPRWLARMLHRTEWRQTVRAARGSILPSEIGMTPMAGRDYGLIPTLPPPLQQSAPQCRSSSVGPFLDLLAARQEKCSFSVWTSTFKCSLCFSQVRAENGEFCTSQSRGLSASCVFVGRREWVGYI